MSGALEVVAEPQPIPLAQEAPWFFWSRLGTVLSAEEYDELSKSDTADGRRRELLSKLETASTRLLNSESPSRMVS